MQQALELRRADEAFGTSLLELHRHESVIEALRDAAARYARLGDPSGEERATTKLAQAHDALLLAGRQQLAGPETAGGEAQARC
jgi:hypothetical protein